MMWLPPKGRMIVESPVPANCQHRSLILTNEIYETTDWYNNHSSLNIDQAAPDADGKLRPIRIRE